MREFESRPDRTAFFLLPYVVRFPYGVTFRRRSSMQARFTWHLHYLAPALPCGHRAARQGKKKVISPQHNLPRVGQVIIVRHKLAYVKIARTRNLRNWNPTRYQLRHEDWVEKRQWTSGRLCVLVLGALSFESEESRSVNFVQKQRPLDSALGSRNAVRGWNECKLSERREHRPNGQKV